MSGYLNRVQLIGNLGDDPQVRVTQAGKKIVTLSIATTESWRDKQSGERVQSTEWHRVVVFNEGLAGIAEQYLTKGAKVLVEGKLVTNKWKDREGNDRYTTEVQIQPYNGLLTFLDSRKQDGDGAATGGSQSGAAAAHRQPAMAGSSDLEDEVPF